MVIISNGFNKFHLSGAAAEASRRKDLAVFITGAYPGPWVQRALATAPARGIAKLQRLRRRGDEIPPGLVRSGFLSEAICVSGSLLKRFWKGAGSRIEAYAMRRYSSLAKSPVVKGAARGARVYHYRSGFGLDSVALAKSLGMVALCDHSIAHPAALVSLVENHGRISRTGERPKIEGIWVGVLEDLHNADAILVNSDFVKDTFVQEGWDPERIHVLYLGLDDGFARSIPPRRAPLKGPVRLMFAGLFEKRKGAEELAVAAQQLPDLDWRLAIAGSVWHELSEPCRALLENPRVDRLGLLSRPQLAERLCETEVFVFPSLAEGSARVIFEALACGCYVITTPNSGSIVQDGVHGRVVPPGDPEALAQAIREAISSRDRVAEIGARNAALVRERYLQSHYGAGLQDLYRRVLGATSSAPNTRFALAGAY